jgi:nucleoside-diphosphate-sugar epimerase
MPLPINAKIAILGGEGFLGKNLTEYFSNIGYEVKKISRKNYSHHLKSYFDLLINANGNSKKFWANQNPEQDYIASVESVKKSLTDFKFNFYLYISSSDVYPDHGEIKKTLESQNIDTKKLTPYGLHKYQAEQLVKALPNYLILRLSAMVGPNLKKGVIKDIMDGTDLFISQDSYLQFITTDEVGRVIYELLNKKVKNEVFNLGGSGKVLVSEIFSILNKTSNIRLDAKRQTYEMNIQKLNSLINLNTSKEYLTQFYNEKSK